MSWKNYFDLEFRLIGKADIWREYCNAFGFSVAAGVRLYESLTGIRLVPSAA